MSDMIWYEAHRPKNLDELVLEKTTRQFFDNCLEEEEIPHLLFHGPAGSGKTTISRILITNLAAGSLLLNASSTDRGIQVVKTTVKQFASSTPRVKGKMNIIFFDEADGLTPEAQNALKNTIERFHHNCRFIFTCNSIDKVIEPIISRCQVFNFESFPVKKVIRMCRHILKNEGIKFSKKDRLSIGKLVDRYYPDVRSVINNLQACCHSGRFKMQVLDRFDPELFPLYLKKGKIFALRQMWSNTVDFTRLYKFLFNQYAETIKSRDKRADAMVIIAEYMYKDRTIADREINFTACCLEIISLMEVDIDFKSKE